MFAALLTFPGAASARGMDEQRFLAVFFQLHEAMPDLANVEAMLTGNGYRLVSRETNDGKSTVEYSNSEQNLFLICEKKIYPGLATDVQYTASLYDTDATFADNLRTLMNDHMGAEAVPFDDNPGWQAMAWPGQDGTEQVAFSVSHNEEHQVTRIWGHKVLVGDK